MGKDIIAKFNVGITSLFLLFYSYELILSINHSDDRFKKFSIFLVLVSSYPYIYLHLNRLLLIHSSLPKIFGVWFFSLIIESIFISTGFPVKTNLFNTFIGLIPITIFFYFYLVFLKNDILYFYLKVAVLFTLVLIFTYFKEYNITYSILNVKIASLNIAYIPFLMLPTVLIISNKYVRIILVLLITVVIFSSMKRGGLLAFFLSITTYYFIENIIVKGNRYKIKNFIFFVLIITVFAFAFSYFDSQNNGYFMERIEMIKDDEGSGRMPLYKEIFGLIKNSSPIEIFLGHGENAVIRYTNEFSAHNDFLEVFFDYGIFLFILYLFVHLQLIKTSLRLIKQKSDFAAAFSVSYVQFIVFSMISHIIIYPYFVLLTAFWGIVIGISDRESHLQREILTN